MRASELIAAVNAAIARQDPAQGFIVEDPDVVIRVATASDDPDGVIVVDPTSVHPVVVGAHTAKPTYMIEIDTLEDPR